MMAIAAKATGAKKPYSMSNAQIGQAKDFLKEFKPNVLKLASQNNEVVRSLADESAWIGITNLGTDDRVKDAGGPVVKPAYPKEGTIGFIDSEQIVVASKNKDAFFAFENAMQQAPWIAKNFLTNGRPLFNEKAYKLLVNQGHGNRARRLLYNQPEKALEMTIKGPAGNEQGYTDAFNEVFGA
jgi:spermidine/putrescine-binding protein